MSDIEKVWPHWVDALGNLIFPGNTIAVATINGRSPQLVLARVERINRLNSRGQEITARKYFEHPEPVTRKRLSDGKDYQEKGEYRDVPSCSFTTTPLVDARGFTRWSSRDGSPAKKVTYSIPENCIRVRVDFLAPEIEDL